MRDVARAAGVAVETLYSHYPSKRALLDAVVQAGYPRTYVGVPVAETVRQESLEDHTSYVPSRRVSTASSRSSSTMRPPSIL